MSRQCRNRKQACLDVGPELNPWASATRVKSGGSALSAGTRPLSHMWRPAGWAEKMQQKEDLGHTEGRGLCLPCQSGGFLRSGASLLTWETFFLGTL